jgi:hypothetical protein
MILLDNAPFDWPLLLRCPEVSEAS